MPFVKLWTVAEGATREALLEQVAEQARQITEQNAQIATLIKEFKPRLTRMRP